MASSSHFADELQDFLDGRLEEPTRGRVAAHLVTCPRCRRELEALRWVKDEARQLPSEEVPAVLSARVREALDTVDAEARRGGGAHARGASRVRWIATGALIVAAALALFLFARRPAATLPELVARDFVTYASGRLPLEVTAREPRVIEAFFARQGVGFANRVFDLGMMGYNLVGGRVQHVDGRVRALFAYRGADGRSLLCQMYEGILAELPPADETRERNGITFHVHREGATTVVFWQEGNVMCVLASDAAPEAVIQLAYAKAIKI